MPGHRRCRAAVAAVAADWAPGSGPCCTLRPCWPAVWAARATSPTSKMTGCGWPTGRHGKPARLTAVLGQSAQGPRGVRGPHALVDHARFAQVYSGLVGIAGQQALAHALQGPGFLATRADFPCDVQRLAVAAVGLLVRRGGQR